MPVGHGVKVRKGRIVVTAAVDQRQFVVLPQLLNALQSRVEAEVIVQRQQLRLGYANGRAQPVIVVVSIRHDGIEAIVSAR